MTRDHLAEEVKRDAGERAADGGAMEWWSSGRDAVDSLSMSDARLGSVLSMGGAYLAPPSPPDA